MVCYVSVNSNWVHPPGQPPGISSKTLPEGQDLNCESCLGAGNLTRARILLKMKVKLQKNSVDQIPSWRCQDKSVKRLNSITSQEGNLEKNEDHRPACAFY